MLSPGKPVRLIAHVWPFLYSVLSNGDLVMNRRLALVPTLTKEQSADAGAGAE